MTHNCKHPAIVEWREAMHEQANEPDEDPPIGRGDGNEKANKLDGPRSGWDSWILVKSLHLHKGSSEGNAMGNNGRSFGNARLVGEGPDRYDSKGGVQYKYRPITCLNTTYKLYTGVLAALLMDHVRRKDILPKEQKALRKGREGVWMLYQLTKQ